MADEVYSPLEKQAGRVAQLRVRVATYSREIKALEQCRDEAQAALSRESKILSELVSIASGEKTP